MRRALVLLALVLLALLPTHAARAVAGFGPILVPPHSIAPFTPLSIAGAMFWVRADLGVSYATSPNVSGWADQSGSGDANRNLGTSGAGTYPTFNASDSGYNNNPTLSVSSSGPQCLYTGSWSSPPPSSGFTLLIVGNNDASASGNELFFDGLAYANVFAITTSNTSLWLNAGGTYLMGTTAANATASAGILGFEVNAGAGSGAVFFNSTTANATTSSGLGSNTMAGLTLGCAGNRMSSPINGKLAEAVMYDHVLSGTDMTSFMNYAAARYGITLH